MNPLHFITPTFGLIVLFFLVGAGIIMMVRPPKARQILTSAGIAIVIFIVGSILWEALPPAYLKIGNMAHGIVGCVAAVLAIVGATLVIAAGFTYLFNSKQAVQLLKQAGIIFLILLILPKLFSRIAFDTNSLTLLIFCALVSIAAFAIRERRLRKTKRLRRPFGAERTPILPPLREEDEEKEDYK